MRWISVLLVLAIPLLAQQGPVNLDFAESGPEGSPAGWSAPRGPTYVAATTDDCRTPDSTCAVVRSEAIGSAADSGVIMQSFDAAALRGKQVRYRAWLRVEGLALAQLFVRVDRPSGVGFHQYLDPRIRSRDWTLREIVGAVDADATRITIGLMFRGLGSAYMADAEFETVEN